MEKGKSRFNALPSKARAGAKNNKGRTLTLSDHSSRSHQVFVALRDPSKLSCPLTNIGNASIFESRGKENGKSAKVRDENSGSRASLEVMNYWLFIAFLMEAEARYVAFMETRIGLERAIIKYGTSRLKSATDRGDITQQTQSTDKCNAIQKLSKPRSDEEINKDKYFTSSLLPFGGDPENFQNENFFNTLSREKLRDFMNFPPILMELKVTPLFEWPMYPEGPDETGFITVLTEVYCLENDLKRGAGAVFPSPHTSGKQFHIGDRDEDPEDETDYCPVIVEPNYRNEADEVEMNNRFFLEMIFGFSPGLPPDAYLTIEAL